MNRDDLTLLIRDLGDRPPVNSGPRVGRQAVMVEAPHSMSAHILLLVMISKVVSITYIFRLECSRVILAESLARVVNKKRE